jgi:hypothetical protein
LVSPNVLDFGSALINTTAQKSVTLVNCSTAGVAAISADVIGSDANIFVVDNAPSYLAAGASVSVNISYSPLALETRSLASVVFMGGDGEKATLSLFGEPAGIALTLGPNPINFGYVALQSTAVACTVVTNQSNMPVTIMGTSEFETDGNAFALATTDDATPPNPFSLPITIQVFGASSKVCFSFTPPIAADYNGQVTLTIDIPSVSGPVVSLAGWGGGP